MPAHTGVGAGKTVGPECDTGFLQYFCLFIRYRINIYNMVRVK